MPRRCLPFAAIACLMMTTPVRAAEDPPMPSANAEKTVEQLAASARSSVVVVTHTARDGRRQGLGTGFVVGTDGLIATNLHVLGDARPIQVQLADGKRHKVTEIHASDRSLDLALIRINARGLTPLPLADSDTLKDGQAVVALGNPHGLKHSVVAGVVSGRREIGGRQMIQLAIPIERGNSGGPLLDMQGRVHGILTMKSLVTENLGFAVAINHLKPLLNKPNPIPMERWLTIGTLDPGEWTPLGGARWRQRAGRIQVDGLGGGFGGRSLCLWQRPLPEVPFEVAVTVKLEDEAGAAGLVFHADGGDKHYGFYPSAGELRLTRFEGPDVFSWSILHQEPSSHYQPGEWNTLKVRIEKEKVLCYVNDQLVIESTDTGLTSGRVGLAKFRDTVAEFKNFRVAKEVPPVAVPRALVGRIHKSIEGLSPRGALPPDLIDRLAPEGSAGVRVLRERARLLEQQAAQLRHLADAVHGKRIQDELTRVLQGDEDAIDLLHAALLLARLDNDELDLEVYRKEVERMVREIRDDLPKGAEEPAILDAINKYLFTERGFHGSRSDYYNRSNSYLNEVIDDREGIPITLSVLYMEVARRLGLKVVGVGLPAHFVVRHQPAEGEGQLIDVYEGGRRLSREEADRMVRELTGEPLKEEHLAAATKRSIIIRMLHNLMRVARDEGDADGLLRYLDTVVAISEDAAQERWLRAVLRYQSGQYQQAREDADWLLDHQPEGIDLNQVRRLRQAADRPER